MDKALKNFGVGVIVTGSGKSIFRDAMTILIFTAPVLLTAVTYIGVPLGSKLLFVYTGFDLSPYFSLITAFMVSVPALMYGMISGFTILDEKDENILVQIALTPFGLKRHFASRMILLCVIAFIFSSAFLYFNPLYPVSLIRIMAVSVNLSLEGAIAGLFIAGAARNKVEGLTIGKALGIFMLAPALPFFIQAPFHYFAGIIPGYWIGALVFAPGPLPVFIIASILIHAAGLYLAGKKVLGSSGISR